MDKSICLENDFLKVVVSTKGAELISLFNKKTLQELIWQADPKWWGKSAPILFPRIGYEENNLTSICEVSKHGFTRDHHFEVINTTKTKVTMTQNENMIENFELPFQLNVEFELHDAGLVVTYSVISSFEFMIGSHPAFNIIPNKSFLNFHNDRYYLLKNGKVNKDITHTKNDSILMIEDSTFNQDALIFINDNQESTVYLDETLSLHHNCEYLGIWSPPKAPFVCIEPWFINTHGLHKFSYTITPQVPGTACK